MVVHLSFQLNGRWSILLVRLLPQHRALLYSQHIECILAQKNVCQYDRPSVILHEPINALFHAREGFQGTMAERRGVICADSREAKALCPNGKYLIAPV